ncbi:MAG TPA: putative Ig domain-containing protein [Thermoanaerobaculia bacterium]|nr:putative Ig domain-containing protein [Thermoanaerobaculia bacterium]
MRRIRFALFLSICAAVLVFPSQASAVTIDFRVLIDSDNDATTGCNVSGMSGVEHILVTRVETTDTSASVTSSHRFECTGGFFGPQLDPSTTGWPAGLQVPSGHLWFETRIPYAVFGGTLPRGMRFGFEAKTFGTTHSILTNPNNTPILFPPMTTPRRRSTFDPRTIVMDHSPADWGAMDPHVKGSAQTGTEAIRILKIFMFGSGADDFLYFGFDGFVSSDSPYAQDDDYTRPIHFGLTVPAPGVLANDADPDGAPLTALPVSTPNHGSVTLNPDGSFTYTPDNPNIPATDSFQYKANNGTEDSNVAKVKIKVSIGNGPPVGVDDNYNTTEDVQLAVPAPGVLANDTDPDGDTLTASLLTEPSHGVVVLNTDGGFTYTPSENFFGTDSFTYTVSDGSETDTATVTITVESVNDAPVADDKSVTTNEEVPVAVTLTATDTEGDPLTFNVTNPANGVLSGTAPNLTYTPNLDFFGSDSFTYTANDGSDTSNVATVSITVNPVNDVPVFTPGPSPITHSANAGPYSQSWATGISAGPNEGSQVLNFIVSNNNNALFSVQPAIAPDGTLTFTPAGNVLGSATVDVQLHDNGGTANGGVDTTSVVQFTITITCPTIAVTNPATTTGTAGTAFSQTFTQNGGIGAVTFTTSSTLPNGLTLAANGTLSGTPTQTGTFPIVVTVTDSQACTGTSATYNLVIGCPTITVTNPATTTGTVGTAFSQTFTQTGAVGGATFTTSSTLPNGLSLAANGVLSGTPAQFGTFPIVVTVTDANGCTGAGATYNLIVSCQTIAVTNPANDTGVADAAFSETFTESGALGGATFSTSSTLPTGLTLAANGVLSGTPTQTGTFPIVVTVTDGNGCTGTGSTYTLTITCQTINVTNPANANGTAGSAFSETFTQTGAIGAATFTTASTLPAGLALATNGVLSGTPTQTGTFAIVVTVTDANSCTGTSATYNLNIACQTITVTNPANTNGTANAAFSETFTQSGAIGSATFTTASTLPDGLTLATNGVLSGTPTETGAFAIVVTVTDANLCTGTSATYNLNIACQTITVTNPANTAGTVSSPFSATFTQTGAIGTATFTTASPLPAGITLATDGVLSGTPTQDGSFAIVVTVTDDNLCTGTSATYTLVIACQTIAVGNPATTSSPAGTSLSIDFTQTGAIGTAVFTTGSTLPTGLSLAANGTLSGTPTQGGNFPIVVTVTDDNGCTGTNPSYSLEITCPTIAVTNPGNSTGTSGVAFSETFTQSGGQGTITWSVNGTLPSGISINPSTGELSGTTNEAGVFAITVTATDQNGCQGTGATYNLTINCQTIAVTNPGNSTGTVDAAFSETFTQSGVLGTVNWTVQTGTLPAGLSLNSSTGELSGTPEEDGSFPVTIRVTDTNGCFDDSAYTITIDCQTIIVTNPGVNTGTVDAAFSQTFTQTGAHGTVTWSIETGTPPAGITINSATGELSGTPTEDGVFALTIRATDVNGCFDDSAYTLTINCQVITVTNPANATGTVGSAFSEQFTQSAAHGTATFSTLSTLPAGFSLDSSTGILSGTTNQFGNFPIVVTVTDANGCTGDSPTYNLVINCQTIAVSNPTNTTGTVNAAFSEQFTQTGALGGATFATSSTLPAGITLSTAGLLAGTPTEDGLFPIVVVVTDGNGCTGTSATYNLNIACQTITVTNPVNATGTAGSAFSETFTQTDAVGTVTWSTSGTLPSGISINTSTGELSGVTSQTGNFPITVTATDQNGCSGTGATYTIIINCQTIIVSNPATTSIQAGQSAGAAYTFTATGILGTAAWTLESGTLPTGITLNATSGQLEGSSTVQGSYPVTVRVTDTNSCFDISDTYTLDVVCPVITVSRTGGGAFPAGTFNVAYAGESFTASGGTGPYTFAVTAGTFPTGPTLNSDGTISGTPTATGTFNFTVTATDASSCTGFLAFSIAINPAANGDTYNNLVNNTQAVVTGGSTSSPSTPFVALTGDIDTNDVPSAGVSVVAGTFSSASGTNNVVIAADGTFIYTPPVTASALASDTFNYTITSDTGGTGTPTQAMGTVTLNLANRVWYIRNNAASGGNGQSQSPFDSIAIFNTNATDAAGDIIYVYFGDGTTTDYDAPLTLLNNQQLIGEGVALVVNTHTLVGAGSKPLITNTAGDAVTLANGNTVKGVTVTGPSGNGVIGTNTAGLTVDTVTIQGAGAGSSGLVLTTPTGAVTLTNTAISNSPFGFTINGGTATTTMDSTNTISANAGQRSINFTNLGAASSTTIGAGITDNGTGISVTNGNATATVSFTGTQTLTTTTNSAVTLTSNAGLTNFSGTLAIATTSGAAINASGGGTLNISGANNTVSISALAAGTTGISINGVAIGASNITFQNVTITGGDTGVSISPAAGSTGTFTIAGTGGLCNVANNTPPTDCTGGVISGQTGSSIVNNGVTGSGAVNINSVKLTNATNSVLIGGTAPTTNLNTVFITGGGTNGINIGSATAATTLTAVVITGSSGQAILGNPFGTLTISGTANNVSGTSGLNLTTGAISGMFNQVNSTGGTNGVNLSAVTGNWGATAGSLTGASGPTFNVNGGGGGQITWGPSISQANAANVVTIASSNSNIINFNGNVSSTGTSTGLSISNSSGTYNFNQSNTFSGAGGITIGPSQSGNITFAVNTTNTTAGTAFNVSGGGGAVTAAITYSGTINKTSAGAMIAVDNLDAPGTLTMTRGAPAAGDLTQNHTGATGISVINSTSTNITISNAAVTFQDSAPGFSASGNIGGTINLPGLFLDGNGNKAGMLISGAGTINVNAGVNNPTIDLSGGTAATSRAIDGTTTAFTGTLNLTNATISGNASADIVTLGGGTLGGTGSTITGANRALVLSGVALTNGAGMTSIASSGGANGISLTNVTGGTYTVGSGGNLSGNTGSAFLVSGGSATFSYAGNITQDTASQRAVNISGITGGTITLSGAIGSNGGAGVSVAGTGGTVDITGAMTFNNTGAVFTVSGTGLTIKATNANNIVGNVTSATGPGVSITNSTIGTGGVVFRKVAVSGGANGIVVNNTGSTAGFSVTGDGSTLGSGGTIQNTTGSGVLATSTQSLSLNFMNLTNANTTDGGGAGVCDLATVAGCNGAVDLTSVTGATLNRMTLNGGVENGIVGSTVNGLTISNVTVQNFGDGASENGAYFVGLYGTVSVTNSIFTGNFGNNFGILNSVAGPAALSMTVTGSTFSSNGGSGEDGFLYDGRAGTNATLTLTGNTFTANRGDHFQVALSGSAIANMTFGTQASPNTLTGGHGTALGQGITTRVGGNFSGTYTFDINGNSVNGAIPTAINTGSGSMAGGTINGRIRNNTVGTSGVSLSGSTQGDCILAETNGTGTPGVYNVLISGNTLKRCFDRGIYVLAARDTAASPVNATITGNNVDELVNAASRNAIYFETGSSLTTETATVCADIASNILLAVTAVDEIRIRQRSNVQIQMPGYGGTLISDAAVKTYIEGRNAAGGTALVDHTFASAFANTPSGNPCPQP